MTKKSTRHVGKADMARHQAAVALFGSARQATVTPQALNKALGEICSPSKTVWMLKKIGFKLRANKTGRDVTSYTLLSAPRLKGAERRAALNQSMEVSLSKFRAHMPLLMDDVSKGRVPRLTVIKHGRPFVTLTAPQVKGDKQSIFGGLKGSAVIPAGLDLTKPVFEGEIDAEMGILHR